MQSAGVEPSQMILAFSFQDVLDRVGYLLEKSHFAPIGKGSIVALHHLNRFALCCGWLNAQEAYDAGALTLFQGQPKWTLPKRKLIGSKNTVWRRLI